MPPANLPCVIKSASQAQGARKATQKLRPPNFLKWLLLGITGIDSLGQILIIVLQYT